MIRTALLSFALCLPATLPATAHAVAINGEDIPYDTWHQKLLPGEEMTLTLADGETATMDGETIGTTWSASEPGNHRLEVRDPLGTLSADVTIFVLEPSTNIDSRGYLGTFRMGKYPRNTPRGFIKLEKGQGDLAVSPSFNAGQFLCKQQPGVWPKYLRVSDENLIRLETLLTSLKDDGLTEADTFFVMSGFRSPFYNTAIGSAKFSRHMYGDAADIYLDHSPRDGNMDDINGDGKITKADANFLYDYAQKLYKREGLTPSVIKGGIGSYRANAVHGPFVHVDARGSTARWGR